MSDNKKSDQWKTDQLSPEEQKERYGRLVKHYTERKPRVIINSPDDVRSIRGDDGLEYFFVGNKPICGAKTRNPDSRYNDIRVCSNLPMRGRNRCRFHGGKATTKFMRTGQASRYSRDLPSKLLDRYEESVKDPKILELRDEIAVVESRIGELLKRIDTRESGEAWRKLQEIYKQLLFAIKSKDGAATSMLMNDLGSIINSGLGEEKNWEEVLRTIRSRKSLVESERKRLVEMNQMITAEQAMVLIGFVISTIKTHVQDKEALANISREFTLYLQGDRLPLSKISPPVESGDDD